MTKPVERYVVDRWNMAQPKPPFMGNERLVVLASDYDALQAERDELRTALAQTDALASEAAQRNEDMGRVLIKCREWVYPPDKDCKCDSCAEAVALLSAIDAALSQQAKP